MSLRASLEAVLRKHNLLAGSKNVITCHCDQHSENDPCPELLDDLLAVIPQPSREALEKIIREEVGGHHHYTCHIFCQAHWKIMGDKLMSWASGQQETTCDHRGLIRYESEHGVVSKIRTDLKKLFGECPLCTAPRPGEG